MPGSEYEPKEFTDLLEQDRPQEALAFFLRRQAGKDWLDLSPAELAMLDRVSLEILPRLCQQHTLWLVHHPDYLHQILGLLDQALKARYRVASTVDNIAWLRCLRAIASAMEGRVEEVHSELCLVRSQPPGARVPRPDGTFHRQVQQIELTEQTSLGFLQKLFDSYLEFLRRAGQHELANTLQMRIGTLLECIARDESRPGVVRALFYDTMTGEGHSAFVHVSLESPSSAAERMPAEGTIEYARGKGDEIDPEMQQAALCARQAVDACLKRMDLPDGLDGRRVRWEIGTLYGDTIEMDRRFQGGSIALPLAIAILSEYLARPVPNDLAFTGALVDASATDSHVLPVDGIAAKVRCAVAGGCKVVYVPAGNLPQIEEEPTLTDLVQEHNARAIAAETLDQVCRQVFPPQGSGRLRDFARDAASTLAEIVRARRRPNASSLPLGAHQRYQFYVLASSGLVAVLVFLQGWRMYQAFAPDYPAVAAWTRIAVSVAVVLAAMLAGFALPASTLRHGKKWAWYGHIVLAGGSCIAAFALIGPMLPSFTSISSIYNAPPVAGLLKDLFVIWIFAWAIAANMFCVVAAVEHLAVCRQFITARRCLRWESWLEARLPIHCIYFPWKWGLVAIGVAAAFLGTMRFHYYTTLDAHTAAGFWEVVLGITQDLVFLLAIAIAMLFYNAAVARVRQVLSPAE